MQTLTRDVTDIQLLLTAAYAYIRENPIDEEKSEGKQVYRFIQVFQDSLVLSNDEERATYFAPIYSHRDALGGIVSIAQSCLSWYQQRYPGLISRNCAISKRYKKINEHLEGVAQEIKQSRKQRD